MQRGTVVGAIGVALLMVIAAAETATAQRTSPPSLDFTCHGYVEAQRGTRAYNCIPEPSQQHLMQTFVPPVGSACDEGEIITTSDQPNRRVFQIRCEDVGGPPPPNADISIRDVEWYDATIDVAHWLYFDVVSHRNLQRFTLEVRFYYADGTFMRCREPVAQSLAGEVQEALVIPSVCGSDATWERVSILAPPGIRCSGCGTYTPTSSSYTDAISPAAPGDAVELERVMEEYRLRFQPR